MIIATCGGRFRPPGWGCTHLLRQGRKGWGRVTIEPVTELWSGGALRLPRARVVPLSAPPATYTPAVERYLTGAGIAKSSARIYRISLTTWGWMLVGEPAPDRTRTHGDRNRARDRDRPHVRDRAPAGAAACSSSFSPSLGVVSAAASDLGLMQFAHGRVGAVVLGDSASGMLGVIDRVGHQLADVLALDPVEDLVRLGGWRPGAPSVASQGTGRTPAAGFATASASSFNGISPSSMAHSSWTPVASDNIRKTWAARSTCSGKGIGLRGCVAACTRSTKA